MSSLFLMLLLLVCTTSLHAASIQLGLPALITPSNQSDFYHGAPVVVEVSSSSSSLTDRHLVAAWETSYFPTSLSGEMGQYISIGHSFDGGLSWSYPTSATKKLSTAAPLWSPALFFDHSTGTMYLYFSQGVGATRGGDLYVTKSIDGGVTWESPVVIVGISGFVSVGQVVGLGAAQDVQGLATWVFVVETLDLGSVVVRAKVNSTIYDFSEVVLPPTHTNAVLVPLLSLSADATPNSDATAALLSTTNPSELAPGSSSPLHMLTTMDGALTSGWSTFKATNLSIMNPAGRNFFAAAAGLDASNREVVVGVATFPHNTSTELVYNAMQWSAGLGSPTNAFSLNTTNVNASSYHKPSNLAELLPTGVFMLPLPNVTALNETTEASLSWYLTVYAYDGQLFAARVGLELPPVVPAGSTPPSSSTAIAITFIIIVTVSVILAVVYVTGYIREKRSRKNESALLMKPEDASITSSYGH